MTVRTAAAPQGVSAAQWAGAIGGAGILALFPARTSLFGAYGIGLASGFIGYFVVLCVLIAISKKSTVDFLPDGPAGDANGVGSG